MGRADRVGEGVDFTFRLPPDLFPERMITGGGVRVAELVNPPVSGALAQAAGRLDHLLNQPLGNLAVVARDDRDVGAESPHGANLLLAEGVGGDYLKPVAL